MCRVNNFFPKTTILSEKSAALCDNFFLVAGDFYDGNIIHFLVLLAIQTMCTFNESCVYDNIGSKIQRFF